MKHSLLLFIFTLLFTACGSEKSTTPTQENSADIDRNIYYGDIQNDEILNIDIKTMKLVSTQKSNGTYPYEITNGYDDDLLILNRKDTTVGVIKNDSISTQSTLDFSPRSLALNSGQKLILASSTSHPAHTLLTENSLFYSDSDYQVPTSYGGENATGHPIWVNEIYFLLLDRTESSIELYKVGSSDIIAKLHTSSSVHHLIKQEGFYYGTLEGIRGQTSPGIVKFKIAYEKFEEVKEQLVSNFNSVPKDFKSDSWGFHHLSLHPDGKHLYAGSYEGNVFVFNTFDLSLADSFKAGTGAGHFLFYHDSLIVTNHYDTFKSFYNSSNPKNNTLIKHLSFSELAVSDKIMQSHTSHIVDDFLYFTYNSETKSTFYKILLDDFTIAGALEFEGKYLVMGTLKSSVNSAFSDM